MNKKVLMVAAILPITLLGNTDSRLEAYNILQNEIGKSVEKVKPNEEKYNFDYLKKDVKVKRIQYKKALSSDLSKTINLFYLNEETAAAFLLNTITSKNLENKYKKQFELLLTLKDSLAKNKDIYNPLTSLINFGEYEYFFINEAVEMLKDYGKTDEAISIIESVLKIDNIFVTKIQESDIYKMENLKHYLKEKNPKRVLNNKLADLYNQKGKLFDAYEMYRTNNFNKQNNEIMAKLKKQINFRIDTFQNKDYKKNITEFEQELTNSSSFKIYTLSAED